jgi:phage major head subunit gpT-like protein
MGLLGKSNIAQRAFTEGELALNEAYGRILKGMDPWGDFTQVFPTNTDTIDFSYILDVPRYAKTVGSVNYSDLTAGNYTLTMEDYSAGIRIHKNDLNDDNLGVIQARMRQLANAANLKIEELAFDLLLKGIATTTYGAGPDEVAFFATTHPTYGGTQSNYDSSGGGNAWYLLDCSDRGLLPCILCMRETADYTVYDGGDEYNDTGMIKVKTEGRLQVGYGWPHKAHCSKQPITETAIWAAIARMKGWTNRSGEKVGFKPTHLLCTVSDERAAVNAVKRSFIAPATGGTDDYETVSNEPITGMGLKVIASPWLT